MRLPSPTVLLLLPLLACFEKSDDDDDTGASGADAGDDTGKDSPGSGGSSGGGSSDPGTGTVDPGVDTGGPALDLSSALTVTGGCGDVTMYATTAEGDWALLFRDSSGMAEGAHESGEAFTATYDLSMDYGHAPSLTVVQGSGLRDLYCNDVVTEYSIDHEWAPVSGMLTITVVPTGEPEPWGEYPANATLELDRVWLDSTTAEEPLTFGSFVLEAYVGWLPG